MKKNLESVLKKCIDEDRVFLAALSKSYGIEDRIFQIGKEHNLSEKELQWLNQKLVERHCLPIE